LKTPEIAFRCPHCEAEATANPEGHGRCPACGTATDLPVSASLRDERIVDRCPACEGQQLYVQRDFNQKVGLLVVVVGAVLAPFTPYYSSLFVAALVDAALYAVLPEITICYRCLAHFRGFRRNPRHEPFDLHVAEQYGSPHPK
jgi:Zn finger protein HypA/HybF involved in hydrogenase expression